jgi:Na+:H+ antiporter, NhaA family
MRPCHRLRIFGAANCPCSRTHLETGHAAQFIQKPAPVTPVSPYLRRYAIALLSGGAIATLAVNLAPAAYYDAVEWQPVDLAWLTSFRLFGPVLTPETIVSSLLMPVFFLLIGKELWEALVLKRGSLHGARAIAPALLLAGAALGGILAWHVIATAIETAEEATEAKGWVLPFGTDIVLSYFFGRMIFGAGHPVLQVLLFLTVTDAVLALFATGGLALLGGELRPLWLALPLLAALTGYFTLTRPLHQLGLTEVSRQRADHVWPWVLLGAISWMGVCAAGLPPALGLLPILPVIPHGAHSFGLFAEAEGFLTDPLNRLAHLLLLPLVLVLFLFALTHGGLDLRALNPTTWAALGAYWLGKPLGLLVALALVRLTGLQVPRGLNGKDGLFLAGLMGIGAVSPILALETALPGGAMQEGARLGLGLTVLAGPLLLMVRRISLSRPD